MDDASGGLVSATTHFHLVKILYLLYSILCPDLIGTTTILSSLAAPGVLVGRGGRTQVV